MRKLVALTNRSQSGNSCKSGFGSGNKKKEWLSIFRLPNDYLTTER